MPVRVRAPSSRSVMLLQVNQMEMEMKIVERLDLENLKCSIKERKIRKHLHKLREVSSRGRSSFGKQGGQRKFPASKDWIQKKIADVRLCSLSSLFMHLAPMFCWWWVMR